MGLRRRNRTAQPWLKPKNQQSIPSQAGRKRLRNDSHSIRTLVALIFLGLGLLVVVMITIVAGSGERTTFGLAEISVVCAIAGFQSIVAFGLLKRPAWGRVPGFAAGALMLVGFPSDLVQSINRLGIIRSKENGPITQNHAPSSVLR